MPDKAANSKMPVATIALPMRMVAPRASRSSIAIEPGIFGSFTRRDASGDQEGRNRWPPLVCRAAPGLSSPAAVERD
jgi:hypothetical protein